MNLQFSIKQLGRKRPVLHAKSIEVNLIKEETYTLEEILKAIVIQQVEEFNQKREEKNLFAYFQKDTLEQATSTGKVDFGAIYNNQKADVKKATETVLLAFEDGLIAVFADDTQIEKLDASIKLDNKTIFTFVRLTFLAGSIW